jgi:rhomboid-like protein
MFKIKNIKNKFRNNKENKYSIDDFSLSDNKNSKEYYVSKSLIKNALQVYIIVFACIFIGFILNQITFGFLKFNSFGVQPRTFSLSSFIGILSSWMMHANWQHIQNNCIILAQLLIPVVLFEKQNIFKLLFKLVFASGLFVWLFGSSNSIHIGASGLIFALFGYIGSVGIINFKQKWFYLIFVVLFGSEFIYSIYSGLIPQEHISFSAHFGGLVGGILVAAVSSTSSK